MNKFKLYNIIAMVVPIIFICLVYPGYSESLSYERFRLVDYREHASTSNYIFRSN